MPSLESICPNCMKSASVPDVRLGRRVRCPWCEQRFQLTIERITGDIPGEEIEAFYYLSEDSERVGPLDLTAVIAEREQGRITSTTQVWREGWTRWKFGDALFSSLPRREPASSQRADDEPAVDPREAANRRLAGMVGTALVATTVLRATLFWVAAIAAVATVACLVITFVIGDSSGFAATAGLAIIFASITLMHRQVRSCEPALRSWAESSEPLAAANAMGRLGELLAMLAWALAGCLLGGLVAALALF